MKQTDSPKNRRCPELMAPAGDLESGFAAFQYGADSVYAGLKKFSARAEAVNLSFDELRELTGFAHRSHPPRRVYVALNTLLQNHETAELVAALDLLCEIEADAVIVQDMGVARIVAKHFPSLRLHASTQMAVHNLAGALALQRFGFRRVTLARELTLDEIRGIAARSQIEAEVFVHGALCYSYSGLCLYSSMLRGRSGNRGRCAYPCRDSFSTGEGRSFFPFSMRDLALPADVAALTNAGVASLKIEGRKKSPLYVAAATAFYRRLLDGGNETDPDLREAKLDIQTIFSRPWTRLYVRSKTNRNVTDTETVGHRGAPIGRVKDALPRGKKPARIRFLTERRIERHDGIQLDAPGGRPAGFAIGDMRVSSDHDSRAHPAFVAEPGSLVEVALPDDFPPVKRGMTVYCASSQAVKRKYACRLPKPGISRARFPVDVTLELSAEGVVASAAAAVPPNRSRILKATASVKAPVEAGKNADAMKNAAREAFAKLGNTEFELGRFVFENPMSLFTPVSALNGLRRRLTDELSRKLADSRSRRTEEIGRALVGPDAPAATPAAGGPPEWSVKIGRPETLEAFPPEELRGMREICVDIERCSRHELLSAVDRWSALACGDRIRAALPAVSRTWNEPDMHRKIQSLLDRGIRKWEASNPSAWTYLDPGKLDVRLDWPMFVFNRSAALQAFEMGASGFTFSPEDSFVNMVPLLAEFGDAATVIVYQDTPLFISETCPRAGITDRCPAESDPCGEWSMSLVSSAGEGIVLSGRRCRTVAISSSPFCLAPFLDRLAGAGAKSFRADFLWREYTPEEARRVWLSLKEGHEPSQCSSGNFLRGLA